MASGVAASGVAAGSAPGREFWVKGFGNNTSQNSYDGFSGYSGRAYGLAFGADTNVGSDTRLGLGLSYAKTNVGFTTDGNAGAGSNVSVNTYQLTGYGTRDFGQVYVDGMLSYARHNTSGKRLAALAREATYSTNANQWTARIGAGYRIPMSGKTVFTPLASLEWTNFNQNSYTESGAGALSLNVDGLRVNRTKGGVGFRVSGESTMASGTVFKPELHMGVYNDFNNGSVATTSSFTGGAGSFSTQGQSVQRTSYNVGAGVTFLQGRSGSVGVVYDYEARSSFKGHNFQVQGRWTF